MPCRLGLERLLRKLLKMPGQPAVLYYHYWPPAWGQYSAHYWSGIEDAHEVCRHLIENELLAHAEGWQTTAMHDLFCSGGIVIKAENGLRCHDQLV